LWLERINTILRNTNILGEKHQAGKGAYEEHHMDIHTDMDEGINKWMYGTGGASRKSVDGRIIIERRSIHTMSIEIQRRRTWVWKKKVVGWARCGWTETSSRQRCMGGRSSNKTSPTLVSVS
jgi:hypothetical protein